MKRKLWIALFFALLLTAVCCGAYAADEHSFIKQPTVSTLNGTDRTFTISWKTSFTPLKIELVYKLTDSWNSYLYQAEKTGTLRADDHNNPGWRRSCGSGGGRQNHRIMHQHAQK